MKKFKNVHDYDILINLSAVAMVTENRSNTCEVSFVGGGIVTVIATLKDFTEEKETENEPTSI